MIRKILLWSAFILLVLLITVGNPSAGVIAQQRAKPSILFINAGWPALPASELLDHKYLEDLKNEGCLVDVCYIGDLTREKLFQYNVAVVLWLPPEVWENVVNAYKEKLPLLNEYLQAGGGILFNHSEVGTSIIYIRTYYEMANMFLEPLGLRTIAEVVRDPEHSFEQQGGMMECFIETKNITPHPITKGIDKVYLAPYWWDLNTFQADDNWQILVRTEKTGYSTLDSDAPAISQHSKGTITSAPPVLAVREVGKGRIAVLEGSPVYTFSDGNHPYYDGLVLDEGNQFKLIAQTFDWLAKPSLQTGSPGGFAGPSFTPKPPEKIKYTDVKVYPVSEQGPMFARDLPTFLGLYGIHSNLTDGAAPVSEYCKRAQELGYSYLVFTEPLELMNEDKFNDLVEQCKRASTDDFMALPGIEYDSIRKYFPFVILPENRPRFVITYMKQWFDPSWLSPDGTYAIDQGTVWINNQMPTQEQLSVVPRQCLIYPKKCGVGPWYISLYNGFATHSYVGSTLIDESVDWYLARVASDYRFTPMAYHRILSPSEIPALGETFVSATKAVDLAHLAPPVGKGLVYPWNNHNYVTNGPRINLYGVAGAEFRPTDYLVTRENEWKCFFEVSSDAGLSEVRIMDGTRLFRRFKLDGQKEYKGEVTGFHDQQHYITMQVEDVEGKKAISGPQIVRGARHLIGMSGSDLLNCNDTTYQVARDGRLDFAWVAGGVHIGGAEIGPSLNVPDAEIVPIARDAYIPTLGGRVGVIIDTQEGDEWSINRFDFHFASEDCTILDEVHENHHEAELSPAPNRFARATVRTYSFTPRLYDWNLLLVENEVEILRDAILATENENISPKLITLMYSPKKFASLDHYVYADASGNVVTKKWQEGEELLSGSAFRNLPIPAGGYVGLYPGSFGSVVVFPLQDGVEASLKDTLASEIKMNREVPLVQPRLSFGFGKGGEKLKKGDRFKFKYLVGLKWHITGPEEFEKLKVLYGLDGSPPAYDVKLDKGSVMSTVYALTMKAEDNFVKGTVTKSPEMPTDLPLILDSVNDKWNVSIYDYRMGSIRRVGAKDGVAYALININRMDRNIFFGNALVCDNPDVWLELMKVEGERQGEPKKAVVEIHNPTDEDVKITVTSPLFDFALPVEVQAGATKEMSIALDGWTDKIITITTNELTSQIPQ